jgi:hypothetical protein
MIKDFFKVYNENNVLDWMLLNIRRTNQKCIPPSMSINIPIKILIVSDCCLITPSQQFLHKCKNVMFWVCRHCPWFYGENRFLHFVE